VKTFAGLPLNVKINKRAKRILVKLIPGKGLEVVVPDKFHCKMVPEVLAEKRAWIERTRDRLLAEGRDLSGELPRLPNTLDYKAMDRIVQVDYIDRPAPVKIVENAGRIQVSGPVDDRALIFEALSKYTAKKAREHLLPVLAEISRRTGLKYEAMRVRRQKTRWGSCAARGTISVNAKLLFLPPELVDQLLIHELCHTKHMNHSPQYWACVASYQPDFQRLEEELKNGGKYVPGWCK